MARNDREPCDFFAPCAPSPGPCGCPLCKPILAGKLLIKILTRVPVPQLGSFRLTSKAHRQLVSVEVIVQSLIRWETPNPLPAVVLFGSPAVLERALALIYTLPRRANALAKSLFDSFLHKVPLVNVWTSNLNERVPSDVLFLDLLKFALSNAELAAFLCQVPKLSDSGASLAPSSPLTTPASPRGSAYRHHRYSHHSASGSGQECGNDFMNEDSNSTRLGTFFLDAVNLGWALSVRFLLTHARARLDENHIQRALRVAAEYSRVDLVLDLLRMGLPPSADTSFLLETALLARNGDLIKFLIEDGRVDTSGFPDILGQVAEMGRADILALLLKDERVVSSGDTTLCDKALIVAAKHGHAETVELLLADNRANPANYSSRALRYAAENGHARVVTSLLQDYRAEPVRILSLPFSGMNLHPIHGICVFLVFFFSSGRLIAIRERCIGRRVRGTSTLSRRCCSTGEHIRRQRIARGYDWRREMGTRRSLRLC
jgi:hypothetical protein